MVVEVFLEKKFLWVKKIPSVIKRVFSCFWKKYFLGFQETPFKVLYIVVVVISCGEYINYSVGFI